MSWQFDAFGEDNLRRVDVADEEPGPGQVRLRMRATSLNYRDLLMMRGHYDPRMPLPLVPCSDGVGIVEAVGEAVDLALGERRAPIFAAGWLEGPPLLSHRQTTRGGPLPGTLAPTLVVDAEATVPVPAFLSDVEAATLPCAGVTAWHALQAAQISDGSTVLCLGTGGVSVFALQIAKALGARVAITSSADHKLHQATKLGADFTVNYGTTERWGDAVHTWRPVDGVIEVGGAGTLAQSLKAVRVGGTIALIGVLAGNAEVPLVRILMSSIRVQGIFVGSRAHFEDLCRFVETHQIRPVVDAVFRYSEVPAAFAHLASGRHFGKVVVEHPS